MAIKYTLQIKQNLQAKSVFPNAFALSPGQCSLCDTGCSTEPSLQLMLPLLSWINKFFQFTIFILSSCPFPEIISLLLLLLQGFHKLFLQEAVRALTSLPQGLPLSDFMELSSGEERTKVHTGQDGQGQSGTSFAPFSTVYIFSSIISSFQAGH